MLLTKAILEKLPPMGSTDGQGMEAMAQVKFFITWADWTWYMSEYDPKSRQCFGLVISPYARELGYFNMDDLEYIHNGYLEVERDKTWMPKKLNDCA